MIKNSADNKQHLSNIAIGISPTVDYKISFTKGFMPVIQSKLSNIVKGISALDNNFVNYMS
jgi:hypothetical protein